MPIEVTPRTTFSQIHEQYKPGWFGRGEDAHVRGGKSAGGAEQVYTHNPLMPNGRGEEALARRMGKYAEGAKLVKDAMVAEYGAAVANTVFKRVSDETGRNLDSEVTRGDLNRLKAAVDELDGRKKWVGKPEVAQEYAETWRGEDDDHPPVEAALSAGRACRLPYPFHRDFIDRGGVRYTGGKLYVDRAWAGDPAKPAAERKRDSLAAVADFIREKFHHEPGTPEFDRVAGNLFRYVDQAVFNSANAEVMRDTGGRAGFDSGRLKGGVELAVRDDGVHMTATVMAVCIDFSPEPSGLEGALYSRQDELRIDSRRLGEADFDPLAAQLAAHREVFIASPPDRR